MIFVPVPLYAINEGDQPPDFTLASNSGTEMRLANYTGKKVVYLDFWASWCASCTKSLSWLHQLQQRYGSDNIQVITVNVDEHKGDAERALRAAQAELLVGFDPEGITPEKFDLQAMPTSYLIGKDGRVRSVFTGLNEENKAEIERSIDRELAAN